MPTTIPSFTPYPDPAPVRGDRTVFRTRAESKVAHDAILVAEANNAVAAANLLAAEVMADAAAAESAKGSAETASAQAAQAIDLIRSLINFQGSWSDLTGALEMPASVLHGGVYWQLLADLADVTASEPDEDNEDWVEMSELSHLYGAVMYAVDAAGFAGRELDRLRNVYVQQGTATIYNRGTKSGCAASKSTARKIDVAAGQFFMDGRIFGVPAEIADAVTVPDNDTAAAATCYVYIYNDSGGDVAVGITDLGETVTDQGAELCSLAVPAGNTAATDADLASVTLTDTRRIEANWPSMVDAAAFDYIALDYIFQDNEYQVDVDIDSYAGSMAQVGDFLIEDRLRNGFKLYATGTADQIALKYTARRLKG